ncbi:geraniol 8-hydroxylase-like [Diospyros lotus]|uniref:geraniol 8-hydroxylase-like n=1 Tax=Diospyros lotus TaxID=55363 RepID=UPI00224E1B49|nr:geraniol 8-hydroxylase-like [Diospyros lotus]
MELYILLICISISWFFFFFFNPLHRRSSAKKLPPGPAGLPLIGSLHSLGPRPNQSLAELSKIYGPIMTLKLGSVTTVVASSADAAKAILQTHDHSFSGRPVPASVATQPNPDATIAWVPPDNSWRTRRRICATRMLNAQKLDQLQHLRQRKAQELVSHIKRHAVSEAPVDIGRAAFATTLNLMSNTIFSIDMVGPDFDSAQEFKDLVWTIMENAGKPNLSDYFPVLRRLDLQGLKRRIRPAYRRLHEIFDEIIEKRLRERDFDPVNGKKGDFLDALLDQCEEDGSNFNSITIKPVILDLFIAGTDTSAITTEWAMAELLRNPNILERARNEIIRTIGADRQMQESDIDRLPYLRAVVKETMRLHPPSPLLLPHKARSDVELLGFIVSKNTRVVVNAWAIGRDPKHWEDPSSFSPQRFLNSSLDYKGRDFEYIPFGAGRRICPGMPLAIRMVHLMLASILQSFNWKLPPGTMPEKMDMEERFGVTLKKAVPLLAIPVMETKL